MVVNQNSYQSSIQILSGFFKDSYGKRAIVNTEKTKMVIGNSKIGNDTIIINMGTAHNCPSAKLGLCEMALEKHGGDGSCYALKAEYFYPQSMPYRIIQKLQFDLWSAERIANDIFQEIKKHPKKRIKWVRFNESGDFHNIDQVRKADRIARLVKEFCLMAEKPVVKFYTYTHRSDIFVGNKELIESLSNNFTINGSGFEIHNNFKVLDISRQERDQRIDGVKINKYTCLDDCSKCSLCKVHGKNGITIIQAKH